ncbi:putative MATE family efflux protein [Catenibacillus scindens]|uniref:Putative MATE family efflux protein n=1 Tax=Catenibacillus scindens TaxID=673271 RepID=A0A7W8H973_9FIRM|nr:MATE family efflux transporter [Catenibacillus scindens]MBB5264124.1 putative MATE family efflux protein [Catenibacillus scindens]
MNETKSPTVKNAITEGVIWKQLLIFFFPILLGTFFQQIYNTADAIVVGRFVGKEALACVGGSTAQIINLIVGFFVGLSSGATVVLAQYYGAKDKNNVERAMHTAAAFAIIGGLIITVLGIVLTPQMLALLNTPKNLMEGSSLYLRIYFAGALFVFIYNIGSGLLRAVGDSKRPLYFLIICCCLNIVLDLVLVVGAHMGVAGVAIGTFLSQGVSAILIVITLMRTRDMYQLHPRKIHLHGNIFKSLLKIGLPAGFESVLYTISNMIIQASLNSFGTDTVAAWTAYGKMDSLFWMVLSAFGISITTFVGQNFGAKKYDRMRKSVRVCLGLAIAVSLILTVFFLFLGHYVFMLFTTDAGVIDIGMGILRIMVPGYTIYVFIEILAGALRGTGDVIIPMTITCGGICVLRVIWIFIAMPMRPQISTIIYSYPISWVITAILFICYYTFRQRQRMKKEKEN